MINEEALFDIYISYGKTIPVIDKDLVDAWNLSAGSKDEVIQWVKIGVENPYIAAEFKKLKITPEDLLSITDKGTTLIEDYLNGDKTIKDILREKQFKINARQERFDFENDDEDEDDGDVLV